MDGFASRVAQGKLPRRPRSGCTRLHLVSIPASLVLWGVTPSSAQQLVFVPLNPCRVIVGWGETGVWGYGNGFGVWCETANPSGYGGRGNAYAGGVGVWDYSGGNNYGVLGESINGVGVRGYAPEG